MTGWSASATPLQTTPMPASSHLTWLAGMGGGRTRQETAARSPAEASRLRMLSPPSGAVSGDWFKAGPAGRPRQAGCAGGRSGSLDLSSSCKNGESITHPPFGVNLGRPARPLPRGGVDLPSGPRHVSIAVFTQAVGKHAANKRHLVVREMHAGPPCHCLSAGRGCPLVGIGHLRRTSRASGSILLFYAARIQAAASCPSPAEPTPRRRGG